MVKTYQFSQPIRLGGERFDIENKSGRVDYQVEGSFLKLPKTLTIVDRTGHLVSRMKRELVAFLPSFRVTMADGTAFNLRKQVGFFRDRYVLDQFPLTVEGDLWDLNLVFKNQSGQEVAQISKTFFRLTSTYQLTIFDEVYTPVLLSLAVALDYLDKLENRS